METIITQLPDRAHYLKGRFTVKIGYPWLSYGAIMAIEEVITPEFDILEFGAGGSTIFFSRRCRTVKSLESNTEWIALVKKYLSDPSNVDIQYSAIENTLEVISKEPKDHYDLILVDNGPNYQDRKRILDDVPPLVKKGGYLVLDNYTQRLLRKFKPPIGWDCYTFDDIRYHGTGTRIYKRII